MSDLDVRQSTVFYETWYKTISKLPVKEQLRAYQYIFDYSFYGAEPEEDKTSASLVFSMAKPNLDSAHKRYDTAVENGKKGGRPKTIDDETIRKIVEMRKNGLTQKEVASQLSLSIKSIQRVEQDIRQNHNVNDNVNVNENDNIVRSVARTNSFTDVHSTLADARSAPDGATPDGENTNEDKDTNLDFQCLMSTFSTKDLTRIAIVTYKELRADGQSHQQATDSVVETMMGRMYQCQNADAIIACCEYANSLN